MAKKQKILIIQTAFIGDIVLTTPLFRNVKKHFPESELVVLTTPQGEALLKSSKEIDQVISFDKKGRDKGFAKLIKLIRKLKNKNFDLCISPHRSMRSALIAYASGASERIGFSDGSCTFLYNKQVKRDKALHEVERILSLTAPLDITISEEDKQPHLEVSEESSLSIKQLFAESGITEKDRVVAVGPGSVWPTKSWTPEGYASLIDKISSHFDVKILLIGGPADKKACDEVMSLCNIKPVDLVGKTRLDELIAVIDRSELLIGNDSSPGHIATARNVPVISIFGPTVPAFGYTPYGQNVVIIQKDLSCRPCHHHGPVKCPEAHFKCMKDISSDEVFKSVTELINNPAETAGNAPAKD